MRRKRIYLDFLPLCVREELIRVVGVVAVHQKQSPHALNSILCHLIEMLDIIQACNIRKVATFYYINKIAGWQLIALFFKYSFCCNYNYQWDIIATTIYSLYKRNKLSVIFIRYKNLSSVLCKNILIFCNLYLHATLVKILYIIIQYTPLKAVAIKIYKLLYNRGRLLGTLTLYIYQFLRDSCIF